MKNIVIVTGKMYPVMSPASACIEKYINQLKTKFNVSVVCQKSTCLNYVHGDDNLQITYVSNWLNDIRNICIYNIDSNKKKIIFKFLLFCVRVFGRFSSYFTYPTRFSWLIDKYYDALCKLEIKSHIDVVISVSNPVCSHLAAQKFKKKHPFVRWITYNTDPFTFYSKSYDSVININKRKCRNYQTESSYYTDADYNIFTEELYNNYVCNFNIDSNKVFCFPYVLSDFSSFIVDINSIEKASESCVLLYAGSLNREIRNPDFALSVLKDLKRVNCFIYQSGDCDDILKKYSCHHIKINSIVNRDVYMDLLCNKADILLNIGNSSLFQAPSKLFELLSTGKPILNFYINKDSQYKIIEKYPLGLNVGVDDLTPISKVQSFCDDMKNKRLSIQDIKTLFPENLICNQLSILESMF